MEIAGGLIGLAFVVMAFGVTISAMLKEWLRHRERRLEIHAAATAEKAAQYAAKTERLDSACGCWSGSSPTRASSSPTRSESFATSR